MEGAQEAAMDMVSKTPPGFFSTRGAAGWWFMVIYGDHSGDCNGDFMDLIEVKWG